MPSATERNSRFWLRSQASPVMSSSRAGEPPAPALLNRISSPPKVSAQAAMSASIWLSCMTSQWR